MNKNISSSALYILEVILVKKAYITIVCTVLIVSMTACTKTENPNYQTKGVTTETIRDNKAADNELPKLSTKATNHKKQIVENIRKVDGVKDSTVVVNGNDIIVGLDVENGAQKSQIENKVRNTLQNANSGYNIHITSEGSLHDRIRTLDEQMKPLDGHPVKNMTNDIKTLLDDMGKSVKHTIR